MSCKPILKGFYKLTKLSKKWTVFERNGKSEALSYVRLKNHANKM